MAGRVRGKMIFKVEDLVQDSFYFITMNNIEIMYKCNSVRTNFMTGAAEAEFIDTNYGVAPSLILDTQDIMGIMIYEAVFPETAQESFPKTTQKTDCFSANHEIVDVKLYENGQLNKPYTIKYCRFCKKEL